MISHRDGCEGATAVGAVAMAIAAWVPGAEPAVKLASQLKLASGIPLGGIVGALPGL